MAMDVREKLIEILEEPCGGLYPACELADYLLDNGVTVQKDAVPVVRCKDCKYGEVDDADLPFQYLCNYHGADWNDENHFCSYGERKDADGND